LSANQLPFRKEGMIHIGIGPYLMKSKIYEINEKGGILFIEEMIEKNVIMPKDYK
jgi:hypothetical protein